MGWLLHGAGFSEDLDERLAGRVGTIITYLTTAGTGLAVREPSTMVNCMDYHHDFDDGWSVDHHEVLGDGVAGLYVS